MSGDSRKNQAFSTFFKTNGTHLKCYGNEEWAQDWVEFDETYITAPCNTSNMPVATISWR